MEWSENVKLKNGEAIVIARTAVFEENWIAGGGGGSRNKGMTLKVLNASRADVPAQWSDRFVPIVIDRDSDKNEWFIVATFFHCESWLELGKPSLPYVEYRFRNGQWIRQPLASKHIGLDANVFPADLSDRAAIAESKPALTVERKEGLFRSSPMSPKFRQVVGHWTTNC